MPSSWFGSLMKRRSRSGKHESRTVPRRAATRRRYRPALEVLEDRVLLSVEPISLADPSLWGETANSFDGYEYGFVIPSDLSVSDDGQLVAFTAMGNNLVPGGFVDTAYVRDLSAGTSQPLNLTVEGGVGNQAALEPMLSADGRFVVFSSSATNLTNDPSQGFANVFVRDLQTDTTQLVSIDQDGTAAGQRFGSSPYISAHGHYVVFVSNANQLVGGDADGEYDLFIRDLEAKTTRMIDFQGGNVPSRGQIVISADERFLFFHTQMPLLPSDPNFDTFDVYRYDLQSSDLTLVSMNPDGIAGNGASLSASVSADGRFVAFNSDATDLRDSVAASDRPGSIWVRDMQSGAYTLVTVTPSGDPANGGSFDRPLISPDGQFVAFTSNATDLTDLGSVEGGYPQVYLRDLKAGETKLVSIDPTGTAPAKNPARGYAEANLYAMSADGQLVAFSSDATNLSDLPTDGVSNLYLRDLKSGITRLVSINMDGNAGGNGISSGGFGILPDRGLLSADGSRLVYGSIASDLVGRDNNRGTDVFAYEVAAQTNALVTARHPSLPEAFTASATSVVQGVSADGRYVLFESRAQDLVDDPCFTFPITHCIFRGDRLTGETILVSVQDNGNPLFGFNSQMTPDGRYVGFTSGDNPTLYVRDVEAGSTSFLSLGNGTRAGKLAVSADGRLVAFASDATDLVPGYVSGNPELHYEIYVWNRRDDRVRLVSENREKTAGGNGDNNLEVAISPDGRYVAFASSSSDLVEKDTNGHWDLFVRDLNTDTTRMVSVNAAGTDGGNDDTGRDGDNSLHLSFSNDGQLLAFISFASDLAAGATGPGIYVRDIDHETTVLGPPVVLEDWPILSGNGQYLVFHSLSALGTYVPGPGDFERSNVFRYDLQTGTIELVSVNADGNNQGNGYSGDSPDVGRFAVSDDGQLVAFVSSSTDLVPDFTPPPGVANPANVYVRDMQARETRLLSRNTSGTGGSDVEEPFFDDTQTRLGLSANGAVVAFSSYAGNLYPGDTNATGDVFAARTTSGTATIRGRVFLDANANAQPEEGEPGLTPWTVFLDANDNGRLDGTEVRVQTDAQGEYTFTSLETGTYLVRQVRPDNYAQTLPADDAAYTVIISSDGQEETGRDFGNRLLRPDLLTSTVSGPPAATPGLTMTFIWTVTNSGELAALGSWQDAVYVSTKPALDADAVLVAVKPHTGGLARGDSYNESAPFTLPPVTEGTYYVLVQADRRRQVADDLDRSNNTAASATTITVTIPSLTLGAGFNDSFTAPNQERYYQVTVPDGETLRVVLDSSAANGGTEVYVRRVDLPTPYEFEAAGRVPGQPDQQAVIPLTQAGKYYVLAHSRFGAAANDSFTITASLPGFGIDSIDRNSGGNAGRLTIAIRGSKLTANTTASLVPTFVGPTLDAVAIDFRDPSLLYATFDLSGQALGTYDVKLIDGIKTATLSAAFQVVAGQGFELRTTVVVPSFARFDRPQAFYVTYANSGDADGPAPLLIVTSPTNTPFGFSAGDLQNGKSLVFLGLNSEGDPGVLPPGVERSLELTFRVPGDVTGVYTFAITAITGDDAEPLNFSAVLDFVHEYRKVLPEWPAAELLLRQRSGSTFGEFVRILAANAKLLPPELGNSRDPSDLLDLEVEKALADLGNSVQGKLRTADPSVDTSGRTVLAVESNTRQLFTATTLNDGSFLLPLLSPGTYQLAVEGVALASPRTIAVQENAIVRDVVLEVVPGTSLSGRILAPGSTSPISNAEVAVQDGNGLLFAGSVFADGTYQVNGLAPGVHDVIYSAPGRGTIRLSELTVGTTPLVRDVELPVEAVLKGQVLLQDGAQNGELIRIRLTPSTGSSASFGQVVAFAGPEFQMERLAPGSYDLHIQRDGYVIQFAAVTSLTAGESRTLPPIVLVRGATVTGRITSPVPTFQTAFRRVELLDTASNDVYVTNADEGGRFVLNGIPPGTYSLEALLNQGISDNTTIQIQGTETLSGQDFAIHPGAVITGILTNSFTGSPQAGARVQVLNPDGTLLVGRTDTSGRFRFTGLEVGTHRVFLNAPTEPDGLSVPVTSPDGQEFGADLQRSFAIAIRGRLLSAAGTPYSGGTVFLVREGVFQAGARAGADGHFGFLPREPGTYDLEASLDGASFQPVRGITVQTGESRSVDLVAGSASLLVLVQGQAADVAGATVVLHRRSGNEEIFAGINPVADTGMLQFSNLVAGTYVVRVVGKNNTGASGDVVVPATGTISATLELTPQGRLTGTIRDAGGSPIAGAAAVLSTAGPTGQVYFPATTHSDGSFEIAGVPQGIYDVAVAAPAKQPIVQQGLSISNASNMTVNLSDAASSIHGRVVVGNTQLDIPIGEVLIGLYDAEGHFVGATLSREDGTFTLPATGGQGFVLTFIVEGYFGKTIRDVSVIENATIDLRDVEMFLAIELDEPEEELPEPPDIIEIARDEHRGTEKGEKSGDGGGGGGPSGPGGPSKRTQGPEKKKPAPGPAEKKSPPTKPTPPPPQHPPPPAPQGDPCKDSRDMLNDLNKEIERTSKGLDEDRKALDQLRNRLLGQLAQDVGAEYLKLGEPLLGPIKDGAQGLPNVATKANDYFTKITDLVNTSIAAGQGDNRSAANISAKAGSLLNSLAQDFGLGVPKGVANVIDNVLKGVETATDLPFDQTIKDVEKFNALNGDAAVQNVKLKGMERKREELSKKLADCDKDKNPDKEKRRKSESASGRVVRSVDPNDIVGPGGFDANKNFIRTEGTWPYTIRFENSPRFATAPAQEVTITHQLDNDLDWTTFAFSTFGFGSLRVNVPDELQQYAASLDYHNVDGSPLRVDVGAGLDLSTGIVTWTFRSLDPATGQWPEDPFAGFLPVNDDTRRGEGFVTYTVRPKSSLVTGTTIDQQASIVFDVNAPMLTNVFTNTIDAGPPTSGVHALPASQDSADIAVSWSGNDRPGSGVASYDVYVSDNGGPFNLFLQETQATSAIFTGTYGRTYGFYSVASDNVGNREAAPGAAQATVAIVNFRKKVTFANGIVRAWGTDAADAVALAPSADGTKLQVTLNGKVISSNRLLSAIKQIRIFARDGNDTITLSNLAKPVYVEGGPGTDKVVVNGRASADTFVLAASSLKVNGANYDLNSLESLAIKGQDGNDSLTVQALPSFPVSFNGSGGSDKVQGPNTGNTWALTSSSGGTLNASVQFGGVEKLMGGTAADTLVGPNQNNTWNITSNNAGKVNALAFSGIESLTGNAKKDDVILGNGKGVLGQVDGGGGRNSFNYSAYTTAVTVDLEAGTASNIQGGISNIRDVFGGSAGDILKGDAQDNLLVGNGGNDTIEGRGGNNTLIGGSGGDSLTGGDARDLIFGGTGGDTMSGNAGEDILFSGTTTFETNRAALNALFAFWNRLDLDYATRLAQLRAGVAGVPKLDSNSVLQDDAIDTLTGGDGLDWHFAKLKAPAKDFITDLEPGEARN